MPTPTLLQRVKLSLRITTEAFDEELNLLINAAAKDIGVVGVVVTTDTSDALLIRAITTYCRMNFGQPDDYERLKASYDEQKAQLISCTGYGLEA